MPAGSSGKQGRQYEHIKSSGTKRGMSEGRAKQMAARTVNKNRARSGEAKSSPKGGSETTREQLYEEARRKNIEGRSSMSKAQLAKALGR